jgi:hypothetical protein
LRKANISFVMPVSLSAWNNSAPTERIFRKVYAWLFLENLSTKFKFRQNLTRITGTSHEAEYTFFITSRSVFLTMGNISDKRSRENQNTHFMINNFFSKMAPFMSQRKKYIYCRARHATMISIHITRRMRIACWIPETKSTHSLYIILTAFHCNNGCTNEPQYYVIPTCIVRLIIVRFKWPIATIHKRLLRDTEVCV